MAKVKVEGGTAPNKWVMAYDLDPTVPERLATPTEESPKDQDAKPGVPSDLADLGINLAVKPAAKPKPQPVHPQLVLLQAAIIPAGKDSALMLKFSRADGSDRSIYCEKVVSDWISQENSTAVNINLGQDADLFHYYVNNAPVYNHR